MAPRSKTEVRTEQFEFAHGRRPRGRGIWAFRLTGRPDPFWATGTYTDAKRAAQDEAARIGATRVEVLP